MGVTTKTMAELQTYLHSINHQFTAATYNLLTNNCNNFSDACVNFLVNHGIPSFIIDLPNIVFSTPMGAMLRPMIENMQNQIKWQEHPHEHYLSRMEGQSHGDGCSTDRATLRRFYHN